jgi:uncharacterized membrane protein
MKSDGARDAPAGGTSGKRASRSTARPHGCWPRWRRRWPAGPSVYVALPPPTASGVGAEAVKQRTIALKSMPPANKTGMTKTESGLFSRWSDDGVLLD